jgi:hypothetical protein
MRLQVIYALLPKWAGLAARAEDLIADAAFRPVKDEARTKAGFINVDGARAFIKRFDSGPGARAWWIRFRGSRASRSLRGAELLQARGFRRPEPYAASEVRIAGSVRASYLISEPLDNARTLSAFVKLRRHSGIGPDVPWRSAVLNAVAREIRRLHDAGLFSSDLQETNLMLEEAEGAPKIYFVDLDGFRYRRRIGSAMRDRNLVQLDRSIGRFVNRGARLRFLYAYLLERPDREQSRMIVARLLALRAREDRRSAARKAGPRGAAALSPLPRGGADPGEG